MSKCIPEARVGDDVRGVRKAEIIRLAEQDESLSFQTTCEIRADACDTFAGLLPDGYLLWKGHESGTAVVFPLAHGELMASQFDAETLRYLAGIGQELNLPYSESLCGEPEAKREEIFLFVTFGLVALLMGLVWWRIRGNRREA